MSHDSEAAVDEDVLLTFNVYAAELELLVASSFGAKTVDFVELLPLLQRLASSVPRAEPRMIKENQKLVEGLLVDDVLLKGAPARIRALACAALAALFARGPTLPLFQRVNALTAFLAKELGAKGSDERALLGAAELLAHLYASLGHLLAGTAPEALAIPTKHAPKSGTEPALRVALLRLAAAIVEGGRAGDRGVPALEAAAWALYNKCHGDRGSEQARALGGWAARPGQAPPCSAANRRPPTPRPARCPSEPPC